MTEAVVIGRVSTEVRLNYEVKGVNVVVASIDISSDKTEFTAHGKVICTDSYGDEYEGYLDADGTIENGKPEVSDVDVTRPKRK